MEAIIGAVSDVIELAGTILTSITSQPVLLFVLASGFVGIGVRTFKKLTKAAKL